MEVSLFERLIKFGVPSVMLAEQHRMRPEVARLIVPSIYKKLVNHESVFNYPTVPSVSRSVFFLNHCNPEEKEKGASSFYNTYEVEMSLRLADFLCRQGVDEEKITILVTYGAQKEKMLSHKLYNLFSGPIHVTTVDNYQGQENDIIILSLVRNNQNGVVGFLRTPNRFCVALSRARHGLFIFGNIEILSGSDKQKFNKGRKGKKQKNKKSSLWVHVKKVLSQNNELGNEIILRCDRHPQQIVKVSVISKLRFAFIFIFGQVLMTGFFFFRLERLAISLKEVSFAVFCVAMFSNAAIFAKCPVAISASTPGCVRL